MYKKYYYIIIDVHLSTYKWMSVCANEGLEFNDGGKNYKNYQLKLAIKRTFFFFFKWALNGFSSALQNSFFSHWRLETQRIHSYCSLALIWKWKAVLLRAGTQMNDQRAEALRRRNRFKESTSSGWPRADLFTMLWWSWWSDLPHLPADDSGMLRTVLGAVSSFCTRISIGQFQFPKMDLW